MKIAFVSTVLDYPWGGGDALWTATAEHATAAGDQLWLALTEKAAAHARIAALRQRGAKWHQRVDRADTRSGRNRLRSWVQQLRGHRPLVRALATAAPDVVCLCQGGSFDFFVEPDLVEWLIQRRQPTVVICQANDNAFSLSAADAASAARFLTQCAGVVFVSRHNLRLAERQLGRALPNAVVIQNPTPHAPTAPLAWPTGTPLRLAAVCRWEKHTKGLDLLLPALRTALGDQPDWRLDLFGRGPDEAWLRETVRALGLESRVELTGHRADIASIWADHHLLLLPSRMEGCSLAMMEALLFGRPVAATPVGGVDEWVQDGVSGFIARDFTVDAIADALHRAWAARDRWAAMGAAAAQHAHQLLDPQPAQKLHALLARAAGARV